MQSSVGRLPCSYYRPAGPTRAWSCCLHSPQTVTTIPNLQQRSDLPCSVLPKKSKAKKKKRKKQELLALQDPTRALLNIASNPSTEEALTSPASSTVSSLDNIEPYQPVTEEGDLQISVLSYDIDSSFQDEVDPTEVTQQRYDKFAVERN